MRYTAINIGPIVNTLQMGRKPRELWSASYMFSYLMKCIIDAIPDKNSIISPSLVSDGTMKKGVGLYPDRIFIKGEVNADEIIATAWGDFCKALDCPVDRDYFNLMYTTCDESHDSVAVKVLNDSLNKLELINYPKTDLATGHIYDIIRGEKGKHGNLQFPVSRLAFGDPEYHIPSLGEISAVSLSGGPQWSDFRDKLNDDENEENAFKVFGKDCKSYHRYICVVQADGDSVGKTVTHEGLPDGKVKIISDALLEFGKSAQKVIVDFGGLPIYAGGDDLLFIAPVVGKSKQDIFHLLDKISNECFCGVKSIVDELGLKGNDGNKLQASLSYGVSISYYKYPLYEALANARSLLFDKAKKESAKNAVAWKLIKHSGSGFEGAFSHNDSKLSEAFYELIDVTDDGNTVSSLIHKTREFSELLQDVLATEKSERDVRLDAIFEKVFEFKDTKYFQTVRKLMELLYDYLKSGKNNSDYYITMLYSLLRTARFIKGEDVKDE